MKKEELQQRIVDLENEVLKLRKELTFEKINNNALKKEIGDYRVEMTRSDLLNFIDDLQDKIGTLQFVNNELNKDILFLTKQFVKINKPTFSQRIINLFKRKND